MKKKAFTLAEILIALTVIGVISAVTVPVLMQNTNKQEYVTALKKTYSTLSQVTNQIIAEEGSPKGEGSWLTDDKALYDMYKKHLNNARECSRDRGCWNSLLSGEYSEGSNILILAGGVQIRLNGANNLCNVSTDADGGENICALLWVDVNGDKKPNRVGLDTFRFVLRENGLYPEGCGYDCMTYGYSGFGCTCRVIQTGKIDYNYKKFMHK